MISKTGLLASLFCCLWLAAWAAQADDDFSLALRAEQWDTLRHGEALLKQPQLAELMQHWMNKPGSVIELRYPGGEEGEIWVHELMDWLVALGVPSTAMQTLPGSGTDDTIYMVLIQGSN
ncbi:MAG: hypothetical protein HYZ31_02815 [Gammaproteobacteria bacterium]|nr:hypothetical protein [Gammaproteobacteria bacterium]HEX5637694.1 hypothetical protein [Gammaproteobacteria bacterium]